MVSVDFELTHVGPMSQIVPIAGADTYIGSWLYNELDKLKSQALPPEEKKGL